MELGHTITAGERLTRMNSAHGNIKTFACVLHRSVWTKCVKIVIGFFNSDFFFFFKILCVGIPMVTISPGASLTKITGWSGITVKLGNVPEVTHTHIYTHKGFSNSLAHTHPFSSQLQPPHQPSMRQTHLNQTIPSSPSVGGRSPVAQPGSLEGRSLSQGPILGRLPCRSGPRILLSPSDTFVGVSSLSRAGCSLLPTACKCALNPSDWVWYSDNNLNSSEEKQEWKCRWYWEEWI